jgi:hypothetical protein
LNDQAPTSALEIQVEGLLERVTHDREQRCGQLRRAADAQVEEILSSAREQVRTNRRRAIGEERTRIEQGLKQAEALAELELRRRAQQETQTLLQHMWAEIETALERRWSDPVRRREWAEAAIANAATLIGGRPWRIEQGPGWLQAERDALEAYAKAKGSGTVEWVCDDTLHKGLRIRTKGVCLDATIPGLLSARDAMESAFLAEYLAAATGDNPESTP